MTNPLALKLSNFVELTSSDIAAIDELSSNRQKAPARRRLISEGDHPDNVFLLLRGWACRYKLLPDGKRQIVAYLLPGDLCDPQVFILERMDHSIGLLSAAEYAVIPKEAMKTVFRERGRLAQAMWWSGLVDEATLREWLVNMGTREAFERISHLFAELWLRLRSVGLTDADSFELPITQEELGDTMGLTTVHTNRTLQRMREAGLIELSGGRLRIPDIAHLLEVSAFQTNYLHLKRGGAALASIGR